MSATSGSSATIEERAHRAPYEKAPQATAGPFVFIIGMTVAEAQRARAISSCQKQSPAREGAGLLAANFG